MKTRTEIAEGLKKATSSYFLHKGYSCFYELGLLRRGRLRADVLCMNLKTDIVLIEVKSSVSDFTTDKKWDKYLQYCNRMYFAFTPDVASSLGAKLDAVKQYGIGILVLDANTGYLRATVGAKYRPMPGSVKKVLVTRMAWRGGISKRTNRRTRVFL